MKAKMNTTDKTVLRTLTDTDTNKYLKLNESKEKDSHLGCVNGLLGGCYVTVSERLCVCVHV